VLPVWVHADETRIEQLVSKLVSNAIKYTPAGGRVTASVGHAGEAGRPDITRMQKPRRARDLRFKPMTYSLF